MYLCKSDPRSKILFYEPPQDPVKNMSGERLTSNMGQYYKIK